MWCWFVGVVVVGVGVVVVVVVVVVFVVVVVVLAAVFFVAFGAVATLLRFARVFTDVVFAAVVGLPIVRLCCLWGRTPHRF